MTGASMEDPKDGYCKHSGIENLCWFCQQFRPHECNRSRTQEIIIRKSSAPKISRALLHLRSGRHQAKSRIWSFLTRLLLQRAIARLARLSTMDFLFATSEPSVCQVRRRPLYRTRNRNLSQWCTRAEVSSQRRAYSPTSNLLW